MPSRCIHSANCHVRHTRTAGFTLVEILIAVIIIGILAALSVPAYNRLTTRAKHTLLQSELNVAARALETYAMEKGDWPPDGEGGWPAPIWEYLPPPNRWNQTTPVGGNWNWVRNTDGVGAALRISGYEGGEARALALDKLIDDGVLTAGNLRASPTALLYILQE